MKGKEGGLPPTDDLVLGFGQPSIMVSLRMAFGMEALSFDSLSFDPAFDILNTLASRSPGLFLSPFPLSLQWLTMSLWLAIGTRLDWAFSSQRSAYLCLLSARIKGVGHPPRVQPPSSRVCLFVCCYKLNGCKGTNDYTITFYLKRLERWLSG